jgi:hypothetical protein
MQHYKSRRQCAGLCGSLLIAGLMLVGSAWSSPVVLSNSSGAYGINGLGVAGNTYDVRFIAGSYNAVYGLDAPTFLGDSAGAYFASIAIADALRDDPPDEISGVSAGPGGSYIQLLVPWLLLTPDGFQATFAEAYGGTYPISAGWNTGGTSANSRSLGDSYRAFVTFDIVEPSHTVPEPQSLALTIIALASLIVLRFRPRRCSTKGC